MTETSPGVTLAPIIRDPRTTSLVVHSRLRKLIIDGDIPPGTELKQAQLAREFGVSRTPMREAFRMLQAEGLIDADVNQRGRVRGLNPQEIDELYAARISLEVLAVRVTTGRLTSTEIDNANGLLEAMREADRQGDMATWLDAHREFHLSCMARIDSHLARLIVQLAERSERYIRLYQRSQPASFKAGDLEHQATLDAVVGLDVDHAARLMGQHLNRTATTVMSNLRDPYVPVATPEALRMTS